MKAELQGDTEKSFIFLHNLLYPIPAPCFTNMYVYVACHSMTINSITIVVFGIGGREAKY